MITINEFKAFEEINCCGVFKAFTDIAALKRITEFTE